MKTRLSFSPTLLVTTLCCALTALTLSTVSAQELEDHPPEGEEPAAPTLEEQLIAMLDPLGYKPYLHVALNNSDWWADWLLRSDEGWAELEQAIAIPHTRCAIVYQLQDNEWWHKIQLFYNWDDTDIWLLEESGVTSLGNGTTYFLENGAVHEGNWFDMSKHYVLICDLPDLSRGTRLSGMFWQKKEMEMYVIGPNDRYILGVKTKEGPSTLRVGETAPLSAIVYDTVRGTEYPDIPVTIQHDDHTSYNQGKIRAEASGTSTLTYSANDLDGNPISGKGTISIPVPDLNLYAVYDSWEFDQTSANWWLVVDWTKYTEIAQALNFPETLVKIEYNSPNVDAGTGHKFVINEDWYTMYDWRSVPANTHITDWLALAHPYPSINTIVCNFADNFHLNRITVYHKQIGTQLFFR